MPQSEDSRAEVILTAEVYGARLHQQNDGMWAVLDQPRDSILWLAVFRSEEWAAAAYCIANRLPQRRDERLPPRFNEPERHGHRHPDWDETVWWRRTAPGIHQTVERRHELEVVYDGRHTLPWTGLVNGEEVCRSEARTACQTVMVEHVRGGLDRIAAVTSRDVAGLRTIYSAPPVLEVAGPRI
jgi:hypothetical protein